MKTALTMALFVAASAAAQGERTQPNVGRDVSKKVPEYVFLDDLLGTKVTMAPSAEARREAAEDGDAAKRPDGELQDLLVDRRSGVAGIAVVSVGGFLGIGDKDVAIPTHLLRWNSEKSRFDLDASEDHLKSLPKFDAGEARKRGLDQEVETLRTSWQKSGLPAATGRTDASVEKDRIGTTDNTDRDNTNRGHEGDAQRHAPRGDKPVAVAPAGFAPVAGHYVLASEIDDPPVYATSEKFGKISKCIVDRAAWNIAFCVVSHGGALGVGDTEYLIPYSALTACQKGDDQVLCVDRSLEQMKTSAVKYEKPKNGVVDAGAAERALSVYAGQPKR